MSRGETRKPSRRQRFAKRNHEMRERRQRAERTSAEPVTAHEPPHATGCLRCFVARQEQQR